MNPAVICQRCGVTLSALSNDGLCAGCMLRSVFEESDAEGISAPPRLTLPRTFGTYELLEELGRGGMGVVYRARQQALNRIVALKLLLGGVYSSEAMLRRFQIEAAAAAALRHPGIVAIHDYGEFEGQPYYTMELMEGRNLAQVAEGRPLEVRRATRYLRQIADAVRYAHGRNILHRDLKPSNILIDHDDRARVADFGMAKRLDLDSGVTLTGQLVGSPNYAAPEQVSGRDKDVGVTTDLYALGALLYHLLTGRPPFLAATLEETLRLLHGTEPVALRELNPGVPRDLETICLKCLAKEPARRYATAAMLVEDLDRFLSDRPIQARPPSIAYRARKYARRNRTLVIATGAVFISLVAGLGVALTGYRRAVVQQRATQAARAQAENLVGFIMRDLQPSLLAHGRLPVVKKTMQETIRYFEALPPELRNLAALRGHAQALETLVAFSSRVEVNPLGQPDPPVAHDAAERALQLRRAILAVDLNDADSAAAAIEDEALAANNSGHSDAFDWKKLNGDGTRRYRELEQQFPGNLRVKIGLAKLLSERGWWEQNLEMINESVQRWEQLIAAQPDDMELRINHVLSLGGIAENYKQRHDGAKSLVAGEKTVAAAAALLQADPTNLRVISIAAAMTREHIWWSEPTAPIRAIEAAKTAQGYYRKLRELDPTNAGWREYEMELVGFEAGLLLMEDRPEPARKIVDDLLAHAEPIAASPGQRVLINLLVTSGELAAATGDQSVARSRLRTVRDGVNDYPLTFPEHTVDRAVARFTWWRAQAKLVAALQDWPELERLGHTMSEEMERNLREIPEGKNQFLPRQADTKGFLGKALLRQGNAQKAVALLQEATAGLRDESDWTFINERREDLAVLNHEDLPEALRLTGNSGQARSLLETALKEAETNFAQGPQRWIARRAVVEATLRLVEVLNPKNATEAEQRKKLLGRAAELFSGPEVEAKMNARDREMKAKIEALR